MLKFCPPKSVRTPMTRDRVEALTWKLNFVDCSFFLPSHFYHHWQDCLARLFCQHFVLKMWCVLHLSLTRDCGQSVDSYDFSFNRHLDIWQVHPYLPLPAPPRSLTLSLFELNLAFGYLKFADHTPKISCLVLPAAPIMSSQTSVCSSGRSEEANVDCDSACYEDLSSG